MPFLGSAVSGHHSEGEHGELMGLGGGGGGVAEAHLALLERLREINVFCLRLFFSDFPEFPSLLH